MFLCDTDVLLTAPQVLWTHITHFPLVCCIFHAGVSESKMPTKYVNIAIVQNSPGHGRCSLSVKKLALLLLYYVVAGSS